MKCMHAYEMDAHEVHAHKMHARHVHPRQMHAHEVMHAYSSKRSVTTARLISEYTRMVLIAVDIT